MKKLKLVFGLLAFAVISANSFSQEFFMGAGYDFYRHGSNNKLSGSAKYDGNAKVRAEWLPYEGTNFKGGIGIAHDFGTKSKNKESEKVNLGSATPFYIVAKPEWELGNPDWKFYNKYRLGWSFNANKHNKKSGLYGLNSSYKSGPYAGIEAGFEYKNVAMGLTFDNAFIPGKGAGQNKGTVNHQLGFQVGYVFGGHKAAPYVPAPVVTTPAPVVEVPETPAPAPVVEKKMQEGRATVNFLFDHPAVDSAQGRTQMNDAIRTLNSFENVDVDITGNTDAKGSDAYNDKLGQARAQNVAVELRNSTDPSKVRINSISSDGKRNPVATNETEAGRAQNRRVDINFRGWFDDKSQEKY